MTNFYDLNDNDIKRISDKLKQMNSDSSIVAVTKAVRSVVPNLTLKECMNIARLIKHLSS